MANTVFTAPKAHIEIDDIKVGYIRDISFNEDIGRADVKGLGSMNTQEVPAVSFTGRFTIGEFFIDFEQPAMKKIINRYGGAEAFLNTLSLGEFSFKIAIYEKMAASGGIDEVNKLVTSVNPYGKTIAVLGDCYLDSQAFSLSNDGVASFNSSGRYLTPVTFKKI